jgi:tetratricopeptide (TPR) repeat protein
VTAIVREGIAAAQVAVAHDQAGRFSEAAQHYERAVSLLQSALPHLDPAKAALRSTTEAKIAEYSRRRLELAAHSTTSSAAAVGADDEHAQRVAKAKLTLNDAMNADRANHRESALTLYEAGLDLLMQLLKTTTDAEEKRWITAEVRRHLQRAEKLKEAIREEHEGLTGLKALKIADDAWDGGEYARALPAYEQAKELLRHEPDNGAHLAHAEIRIELLLQREADGAFVRPIPLGHKPGEKYVNPDPEQSKFQELMASAKEKAKTLKRNIENKLSDDPW